MSAASGFFAADTRFLSRSLLTIDGDRGEPVCSSRARRTSRSSSCEWEGGLAVRRELFVGRGLEEAATVWNRSDREVEAVLELELASDFADIFAVKRVEDSAAPGTSEVAASRPEHWDGGATVEFADQGFPARTLVHLSPAPDEADGGAARYRLATRARRALAPRRRGAVATGRDAAAATLPRSRPRLRDDRRERDASLDALVAARCRGSHAPAEPTLERTWARSLTDLAALRLRWARSGMIPAAGLPWFMTLFGRDALITAFQSCRSVQRRPPATLRALAETQAEVGRP